MSTSDVPLDAPADIHVHKMNTPKNGASIPLNLRPVIFVVNVTFSPSNNDNTAGTIHGNDGRFEDVVDDVGQDEPFDERRASTADSSVTGASSTPTTAEEEEMMYEAFLSALQGRPYNLGVDDNDTAIVRATIALAPL